MAQSLNQYNLNIYNGLPTNHVYNCLVDKHGYLWMTTPRGVVRYNGYETRIFNLSDGLPNEDVWRLFEDNKGRMWLGSIANSIGYIYNGAYKQAVIPGYNNTIYPTDLRTYANDALMFSASYKHPGKEDYDWYVFKEHNDTFSVYRSDVAYYVFRNESPTDNRLLAKLGSSLYELSFDFRGIHKRWLRKMPTDVLISPIVLRDSILQVESKDTKIGLIHVHSDSVGMFHPYPGEKILYAYALGDTLTLFYNSEVRTYDDALNLRYSIPVQNMVADADVDGNELLFIRNDDRWGRMITTKDHGIYINYPNEKRFFKTDLPLNGCQYIGDLSDSISCWWRNSTNALVILKGDEIMSEYKYDAPVSIRKIISYNEQYAIIFERHRVALLNLANYQLDYELKNRHLYPVEAAIDPYGRTAFFSDPYGIYRYKVKEDGDGLIMAYEQHYSNQRYRKIHFAIRYKLFIAHNSDHILVMPESGKPKVISNQVLRAMGIDNIDVITSDKYGNLYIKQNNTLNIYVPQTGAFFSILKNVVLNGSQLSIQDDNLVVAGKFGVAVVKIKGPGQFVLSGIYNNIKGVNYRFLYSMKHYGSSVLLQTDKGVYTLDLIPDSKASVQSLASYRFVARYSDRYDDIRSGDTITLQQSDRKIALDVINEIGYGPVKYSYKLANDTAWQELPGSELFFPDLEPDVYHTVLLSANDLALRSSPLKVYVYVQPYWWQTAAGIRIIWISSIALALVLVLVIILITRKIVTRKNEKRNLQLELELKAIYSQINPHFIFNTLSTALFFIKTNRTKEAYTHIIKFSKLLRAYIRSSRNKYVTIADEIASLNNYVELQQVRFEDKFDYQLIVDSQVPVNVMKIPSLLLQPLVENAINHGIFHKTNGKGHLIVSFKIDNEQNELICTIEDNGVGRIASKQINRNSMLKRESFGGDLVKDLISIFNQYEEMQISMEYIDKKAPETGTVVILRIKDPINERKD